MWKQTIKARPNGPLAQSIYICGVSSTYKTSTLKKLGEQYRVRYNDYREAVTYDPKMTQDSVNGIQNYMLWISKDMYGPPAIIDRCPVASILYQLIHETSAAYKKIGDVASNKVSYKTLIPDVKKLFGRTLNEMIPKMNILIMIPADYDITLQAMKKRESSLDTITLSYLYAQRNVYLAFAEVYGIPTFSNDEIEKAVMGTMRGYEDLYRKGSGFVMELDADL